MKKKLLMLIATFLLTVSLPSCGSLDKYKGKYCYIIGARMNDYKVLKVSGYKVPRFGWSYDFTQMITIKVYFKSLPYENKLEFTTTLSLESSKVVFYDDYNPFYDYDNQNQGRYRYEQNN